MLDELFVEFGYLYDLYIVFCNIVSIIVLVFAGITFVDYGIDLVAVGLTLILCCVGLLELIVCDSDEVVLYVDCLVGVLCFRF